MRRVMLNRQSLETLADIAEHPTLGPSVRDVEVSTNHLLPLDELRTLKPPSEPFSEKTARRERSADGQDEGAEEETEEVAEEDIEKEMQQEDERGGEETINTREADSDYDYCPHLRGLNEVAYRNAFVDQEELIRRGDDIKHLTRAMRSLINCNTISIMDDNRVWGLRRLKEKIGILPQRCLTFESPKSVELVRRMLYALFTALAARAESNTSIKKLKIFSTIENANRISPDMLVKPSSATLDNIRLNTLPTLFLTLDPKSPEHNATSVNWAHDLVQFVNRFPELSHVTIQFEDHDEVSDSITGTHQINHAANTRFSKLSQLLSIPKLEIVKLGSFNCTSMELALFLLRHQNTLKDIHLGSIYLADADGEIGGWLWLIEG
ncbi:hypothetical protein THARTR1_11251 [Trichoderma harzianum]|uniref:Uncharacterized protein n=1 Tax=Trichoderma harzianum TaxID=5544 RepID=A0A2K0T481_TRIHA|nr:hypothetical protein THARTR1_11251 [Trichoderma harzianum]